MNNLNKLNTLVSSLETKLIYRHITTTTTENPNPATFTANYLINSCGFSPEAAVLVSQRFKLSSTERADSFLEFLRTHGGLSDTQISRLVRSYPAILTARSPEKTLLPKIEFYKSLGLSNENVAKTLSSNPMLLLIGLEKRIIPTCNYLRSFGLSDKNLASVFKSGGRILLEGKAKNVEPNVALFAELDMSIACISKLLAHFVNVHQANADFMWLVLLMSLGVSIHTNFLSHL